MRKVVPRGSRPQGQEVRLDFVELPCAWCPCVQANIARADLTAQIALLDKLDHRLVRVNASVPLPTFTFKRRNVDSQACVLFAYDDSKKGEPAGNAREVMFCCFVVVEVAHA